ncbi:MAG: transglycosylase SLT domain-containing protein [Gaiellaceae bacterium]
MAQVQTLSEVELAFARSRRRAAARRRIARRRGPLGSRSVRAGMLALVLLAVLAESTRLEASNARPTVRGSAQPASAPAPCPVPGLYRAAFTRAAALTGVPLPLLVATAYEESQMHPGARSDAGATGLLQVMPATARALRLDGDDPAANVLAGARYLRQMLDRFGSVELALSAYNAGPTAVEGAGGAPTLATPRYVKNVELRESRLTGC